MKFRILVFFLVVMYVVAMAVSCNTGGNSDSSDDNDRDSSVEDNTGNNNSGDDNSSDDNSGNDGENDSNGDVVEDNTPDVDVYYCENGNHAFADWSVKTESTCEESGYKERWCFNCPYNEEAEILPLGHTNDFHSGKSASCTESGYKDYYTCSRCSYTTYEKIDELGHTLGAWEIFSNPGCTYGGIERAYCTFSGCEYYQFRDVKALGHDEKTHDAKDATCTEAGWEEYVDCTRCEYTTYVEIPAGHKYTDSVCTACGYEKSLKFELSNDESYYIVVGLGDFASGEKHIVIPETYNDLSVKEIQSYAFSGGKDIESIVVSDSVELIGVSAFYDCKNLKSIELPFVGACYDAVGYELHFGYVFGCYTYYEPIDFYHYRSKNPYRPDQPVEGLPTKDGYYYFTYNIPETLNRVKINNVAAINEGVFKNCNTVGEIIIGDGIVTIGSKAFEGCENLNCIVLSESVKSIGANAFSGCEAITMLCYVGAGDKWNEVSIGDGNDTLLNSTLYYYSKEEPGRVGSFWHYTAEGDVAVWPAHEHTFVFSHAITEADCYDDGEGVWKCESEKCDSTENRIIPAAHIFDKDDVCELCGDLKPSEGLEYTLSNDGTYYIASGIGTCTDSQIVIANVYKKLPVRQVGSSAFKNNGAIMSVVMQSNMLLIGKNAFQNCVKLSTIYVPDSVTTIEGAAFADCNSLKEMVIGNNVTAIGSSVLAGCTSLESITLPFIARDKNVTWSGSDTVLGYLFGSINATGCVKTRQYYSQNGYIDSYIPESLKSVTVNGGAVFWGAFYGCTNITEIVLGDGVEKVDAFAFYGCTSLSSVTLNRGILTIGDSAFKGCVSIKDVNLPNGVISIGSNAFDGCSSLKAIVVPDSVEIIGERAFTGCSSLESITIPFIGGSKYETNAGMLNLFGYIFGTAKYDGSVLSAQYYTDSSKVSNYIPESLKSVTVTGGNVFLGAFSGCKTISSITLSEATTQIGALAFHGCTSLTSITIPNNVTTIGTYALRECSALETINIGASVVDIGDSVFCDCLKLVDITVNESNTAYKTVNGVLYSKDGKALIQYPAGKSDTEFTVPEQVTVINAGAFYKNKSLKIISLGGAIESIGLNAFYECNAIEKVYITDIGNWCSVALVDYYSTPAYFAKEIYIDGVLADEIVIPDGITSIEQYVFVYYRNITSVKLPDSVTKIGSNAFAGCELLEDIEMNSVKEIGSFAFSGCYALKNIILPGVTTLGKYAFSNCINVDTIALPNVETIESYALYSCAKASAVTLGENLKTIGEYAFSGCQALKNITVPDNVGFIGFGAFSSCASLESITVPFTGKSASASGKEAHFGYIFGGNTRVYTSLYHYSDNGVYFVYSIPKSLKSVTVTKSIKENSFVNCDTLESIALPKELSEVYQGLFNGCYSLNSITIPFVGSKPNATGIYSHFGYIFGYTESSTASDSAHYTYKSKYYTYLIPQHLKHVTVSGASVIPEYAFNNCNYLVSITLADTVTEIKYNAFSKCTRLLTVEIPDSVTYIGVSAFMDCTTLAGVDIPQSVTYLGSSAFKGCTNLKYANIPEGITDVQSSTFSGCVGLKRITIPANIQSIGSYAFYNCISLFEVYNKSSLNIEKGSENNGYVAYYALNVYTDEDGEKKTFETEDGFIFYEDGEKCYLLAYIGLETEIVLPASCNGKRYEIYHYAFYKDKTIKKVTFSKNVVAILSSAFANSTVDTVIFEDTTGWKRYESDGATYGYDIDSKTMTNSGGIVQWLNDFNYVLRKG